jgi:hypothetical protein
MTNESNPADELREDRKLDAALEQCSESQLTLFLHSIEALLAHLDSIAVSDHEPIDSVTDTQNRLQDWSQTLTRILSRKQTKEAYDQLHTWDNEGGQSSTSTSRRLLSRMINGERRLVWADVEESREG